jgi:hypothetical protein
MKNYTRNSVYQKFIGDSLEEKTEGIKSCGNSFDGKCRFYADSEYSTSFAYEHFF